MPPGPASITVWPGSAAPRLQTEACSGARPRCWLRHSAGYWSRTARSSRRARARSTAAAARSRPDGRQRATTSRLGSPAVTCRSRPDEQALLMTTWPRRHHASRVSTRQPVTSNAAELALDRYPDIRRGAVGGRELAGRALGQDVGYPGHRAGQFHPLAGGVQQAPHQNSSGYGLAMAGGRAQRRAAPIGRHAVVRAVLRHQLAEQDPDQLVISVRGRGVELVERTGEVAGQLAPAGWPRWPG